MTTERGPAALQVGRVFNPGCHRLTVHGDAGLGVGHGRALVGAREPGRHEPRLGTLANGVLPAVRLNRPGAIRACTLVWIDAREAVVSR
jgi:hypothetical protein